MILIYLGHLIDNYKAATLDLIESLTKYFRLRYSIQNFLSLNTFSLTALMNAKTFVENSTFLTFD